MLDRPHLRHASMEDAFVASYGPIRATCSAPNAPGVAIFAIDRAGVERAALLPASPDGLQTAIVGSHPEVDLPLDDDTLAPRHLAVVLHPSGDDRLWFRLIDLRSQTGMRDERGERVEHCVSDGPIFVHVGRFCLFVVPLCDPRLHWDPNPHEAWRALPAREFRQLDGAVRRSASTPLSSRSGAADWLAVDPNATLVQDMPGPRFARSVYRVRSVERASSAGPPPIGELLLANSNGGSASVLVDAAAARSGLLLGRDDRCDGSEHAVLDDPRISRVHLLILEIEGVVYAIDAASANGVWRKGEAGACGVPLVFGQRLTIGRGMAWLKWMPPPTETG